MTNWTSRSALVAARLAKMMEGRRGRRRAEIPANLQGFPLGASRVQAGALVNVSPRLISYAIKILRDGCDELVAAVESGQLPVSTATRLASLPKAEQTRLAAGGPAELARKARELHGGKKPAVAQAWPFGVLSFGFLALGLAALAQAPAPSVDQLTWMSGCWEGTLGKARFEEQWMRPAAGSLLGMSRTTVGGKAVMIESLMIRQKDTDLVLTVILGFRSKPTDFKLIKLSGDEVVFENPEHDFPQRIIYRTQLGGGLLGRIEGVDKSHGGKEKSEDFLMKRARCDAPVTMVQKKP